MSSPINIKGQLTSPYHPLRFEKLTDHVRCYNCFWQLPEVNAFIINEKKRVYLCSTACLLEHRDFIINFRKIVTGRDA